MCVPAPSFRWKWKVCEQTCPFGDSVTWQALGEAYPHCYLHVLGHKHVNGTVLPIGNAVTQPACYGSAEHGRYPDKIDIYHHVLSHDSCMIRCS